MSNRLSEMSQDFLRLVHQASLRILEQAGVSFPGGPALDAFRGHGFKVDGDRVFIGEEQLSRCLATVPRSVELVARNPEKSVVLGGPGPVVRGPPGPVQFLTPQGQLRPGTLADYESFQKLAQTSRLRQIAPYKAIYPQDLPARSAHLDMLFGTITLTDLFMGGDSQEAANARDSVKMASLVFGGREFLDSHTVIRATINVLSPLRYAPEQSAALMILSGSNQLAVVTNMAMLGSTAPVDLSASLVLGNAEVLAGIALSQLARPGAPVVYGSTSCPVDMRAMAATLGAPEALWLGRAAVEMARYYGIPSRTGGGLTDSFLVDGQAAAEAALSLQNTLCCGADLVMHAFGMMGGYFASSLEKWVLDEEICSFILDSLRPSEPTIDEAAIEEIIKLGPGANYLVRPSTVRKFRDVHSFRLFNKLPHDQWQKKRGVDLGKVCQEEVGLRLGQYEKPPMDEKLENELALYVKKRKEEIW